MIEALSSVVEAVVKSDVREDEVLRLRAVDASSNIFSDRR